LLQLPAGPLCTPEPVLLSPCVAQGEGETEERQNVEL